MINSEIEKIRQFIRTSLIRNPDYQKYGYNKQLIKSIEKNLSITLTDSCISKHIKKVKEDFAKEQEIQVSKIELINMYMSMYTNKKSSNSDRIRILQEIGKLEGHYVEKVEHSGKINITGNINWK